MPAFGGRPVEQFGVVLLDTKYRVLRTTVLAIGTLNTTVVQPRDVFREAALGAAAAVVVFHNHPSGDPSPSPDDVELTRRLAAAGVLMGIDLVDHVDPRRRAVLQLQGDGTAVSRVLYFDCFSGISGDMVLGALLDAGLPLDELKRALGSLAVSGYRRSCAAACCAPASRRRSSPSTSTTTRTTSTTTTAMLTSMRTTTTTAHEHASRRAARPRASAPEPAGDLRADRPSALSPAGRERAKALFQRLAEAEAAIHQMPVEQVHLHEVGALDSIIDIVGAVFALEWVGADRIVCSPLNVGGGMVHSAHGLFPVPAPATREAARRTRRSTAARSRRSW